jgi:hypothetical protein
MDFVIRGFGDEVVKVASDEDWWTKAPGYKKLRDHYETQQSLGRAASAEKAGEMRSALGTSSVSSTPINKPPKPPLSTEPRGRRETLDYAMRQ